MYTEVYTWTHRAYFRRSQLSLRSHGVWPASVDSRIYRRMTPCAPASSRRTRLHSSRPRTATKNNWKKVILCVSQWTKKQLSTGIGVQKVTWCTTTTYPIMLPTNWVQMFSNVHRHTGQFFLGGAKPSLPKKFSTVPEKTTMLTCKITLPYSPHPVIISKNPAFRALYFSRQNEFSFFSFNKYKNVFFHSWLLASARKI